MDWSAVDSSRVAVGTLGLPLAVAETLYGGSADVHKYWEPALERYVVGKRVTVFDRPLTDALREPQLQHRLRHDHLVPVITVSDVLDTSTSPPIRADDEVEIITPYYQDGSVFDALHSGRQFDVREVLEIGRAAALGLAELHREGIVHRDFKSPNLFLVRDSSIARVGDLGEAHPLNDHSHAPGLDSPTPWIAPEQVARDVATIGSDLFGLGVVLVEMLLGGLDLSTYDRLVARRRMAAGLTALPRTYMTPPPWTPPSVRTLIRQLTQSDPRARQPWTALEVADRLAATPAIGWRIVRQHPRRWEGVCRRTHRLYAIDTRHLPRKGEWEIAALRRGSSGWWTVARRRFPTDNYRALQYAFDAALKDGQQRQRSRAHHSA